MKKKLVIWGTNAQDEKVLIALELLDEANKVTVHAFPVEAVNDNFEKAMMSDWRDNKAEVEFPAGHVQTEIPLSMAEGILPAGYKSDSAALIQRAQTEWQFIILSNKLNSAYKQELAEIKEKVANLTTFDQGTWDNLKGFWDKVQSQVKERTLFREHADQLREGTNGLFEDMKELRKKLNNEFEATSEGVYKTFNDKLDAIYASVESGNHRFATVFEDLRKLQSDYKNARLTGKHRNALWDRIDGAFKALKQSRFGDEEKAGPASERIDKRLSGIEIAIKRNEEDIRRDEKEIEFQLSKVGGTWGVLEAQIREVKINMIKERLVAKKEKLEELKATMVKVKDQGEKNKQKEAERAAADAEKKRFDEAKAAAKAEIAKDVASSVVAGTAAATAIDAVAESMDATESDPALDQLLDETQEFAAPKEESTFTAVTNILGESFSDVVDNVKSIATVVRAKADEAVSEAVKKANEMMDDYLEEKTASAKPAEEVKDVTTEVTDAVSVAASGAAVAATDAADSVVETTSDTVEEAKDAVSEAVSDAKSFAAEIFEEAKEAISDVKEAISDALTPDDDDKKDA